VFGAIVALVPGLGLALLFARTAEATLLLMAVGVGLGALGGGWCGHVLVRQVNPNPPR
jgi:hypothetical protein